MEQTGYLYSFFGLMIFSLTFLVIIVSGYKDIIEFDTGLLVIINTHRIQNGDAFWRFVTNSSVLISLFIPITFLLTDYFRKKVINVKGIYLLICWLIGAILNTILKYSIARSRPFITNENVQKLVATCCPSFPSGHTTIAFTLLFGAYILFPKQRYLTVIILLWSMMVAYSRVALGVHFPSDVIAGIGLGMLSTGVSFMFLNAINQKFKLNRNA